MPGRRVRLLLAFACCISLALPRRSARADEPDDFDARVAAEQAVRSARRAELERRRRIFDERIAELRAERERAAKWRKGGLALLGLGATAGALSLAFMRLGAVENDHLVYGSFATAADISAAADAGQRDNDLALGFGITALSLATVSALILILAREPRLTLGNVELSSSPGGGALEWSWR